MAAKAPESATKAQVGHFEGPYAKLYIEGGYDESKGNLTARPGPAELPVTGAEGYTIREDGIVKRHGHRVEPEEIGLYRANKHKNGHKFRTRAELALHLDDYHGPVPAIGRTIDTNWWSPESAVVDRECLLRMLDELVAYEFLPRPRYTSRQQCEGTVLRHLDGNEQNCSAANLQWIDLDGADINTASLMRHALPRSASKASRQAGQPREPRWTGSRSLPGHTPTSSERSL